MRYKLVIVTMITLARLPLAVLSVLALYQKDFTLAWAYFMWSVLTDVVDGHLARRWQVVTSFGTKADLYSDMAIFWVFVGGFYVYSQTYLLWWQKFMPLSAVIVAEGAFIILLLWWRVLWHFEMPLKQWWWQRGSFWFGVLQIAAVGLFLAVRAGWPAVVMTVAYGGFSCYLNRQKLRGKI